MLRVGDLVEVKGTLKVPYDPIDGYGVVLEIEPWGEFYIYVVYFFKSKAFRWFEEDDLILINSIQNEE